MGAKFLHTHVRTGKADAVAKALCKLASSRKVTLAGEDEPCDHEVVVATHPDSPGWTSIYGRFDDVSYKLSDKLATCSESPRLAGKSPGNSANDSVS
jgi:hypothetical protein